MGWEADSLHLEGTTRKADIRLWGLGDGKLPVRFQRAGNGRRTSLATGRRMYPIAWSDRGLPLHFQFVDVSDTAWLDFLGAGTTLTVRNRMNRDMLGLPWFTPIRHWQNARWRDTANGLSAFQ